jgi:hypothetical protein
MFKTLYIGLLASALAAPAFAADVITAAPEPPVSADNFESRWKVGVAVYLWAPSLSGSTRVGSLPTVDIDASFSDIFDNLDFAFMAIAEARKDRYGIFGDLMYTKLSDSGTGPAGVLEVGLTNELTVATLMGEYRVVENGNSSVDLMAGARLWNVQIDATVTAAGGGLPINFSQSLSETWVDPMIGVKGRWQGSSPWYLTGWGMIGGFGAAADIDWDLFGGVGYDFNDRISVVAGYRAVGVDYDRDDFLFDIVQQGPIFGGVFRF